MIQVNGKILIQVNDLNFPIDKDHRHFSTTFYFKKLSNGEKFDRRWLVYYLINI